MTSKLTKFEIDCSTAERKLTVVFTVDLSRIEAIIRTESMRVSKIVLQSGKDILINYMSYDTLVEAIFNEIKKQEYGESTRQQDE